MGLSDNSFLYLILGVLYLKSPQKLLKQVALTGKHSLYDKKKDGFIYTSETIVKQM